jgi:hypothetical protein
MAVGGDVHVRMFGKDRETNAGPALPERWLLCSKYLRHQRFLRNQETLSPLVR